MNHERRRFLASAVLASTALSSRDPAWAAEFGEPPMVTAASSAAPPPQTSMALDAQADAPAAGGADVGARLIYGPPGPPPIFRVKRDSEVKVHLVNNLSEATSLEWHGMRLPNALDLTPGLNGVPLAPKGSAEITLKSSDAGTFWFHPCFIPGLSDQTARGLAGVLIVEEPVVPLADGDQVLFLTDEAAPIATQQTGTAAAALAGVLVNGKTDPELATLPSGARLRLRIVNGSTQKAFAATFQGARPLVIAIDGQPSDLFAPLNNTIPIGPGARFDVMIDLPRTAGAEFRVQLRRPEGAPTRPPDRPVYIARTEGAPGAERDSIKALAPNPALPRYIPLERSTRATLIVDRHPAAKPALGPAAWTVNGIEGTALQRKPLFSVKRNTPVTLAFNNKSASVIALRMHGHVMRLLHAMDDGWEPYWRDSVLVPPGVTHHAAFVADNPGQWLIDSAFFDQATAGLRTWFEVV